uniref:Uncharacterized protein n=1 Tax=Tanacetum cinerariifolium TaxID=118510 RepID=A0A6L2MR09_TANCI|nr:hypothetical protein [Tanacetum cinerariifolium]
MTNEVDIENLTIKQYLMLTQEKQTHGMIRTESGARINMMPKSLFEHLKLTNLMKTCMDVKMGDMTKKARLGIVENIPVQIDKFLFHSDFVVIDTLEVPNETILLDRPFLATIHAQIVVFRVEISLEIGNEKVKFDMNGEICHSMVPLEKIYMASSIQKSKYFNPHEIENDDSPTLEQRTFYYCEKSIGIVDFSSGSKENEVGSHFSENVSRWHVCKPVYITFEDVGGNGMNFDDFIKLRTRKDPYSRNFYLYKDEFDKEIKQLINEYKLKVGMKRYALEEVWEKCENFMIQPNCGFLYEEIGIRGLLDLYSCGSKVSSWRNHLVISRESEVVLWTLCKKSTLAIIIWRRERHSWESFANSTLISLFHFLNCKIRTLYKISGGGSRSTT